MSWITERLAGIWNGIKRHLLICDTGSILVKDIKYTDDEVLTQELRLKSDDVFHYMSDVRRALLLDHSVALDMVDDVKWIPMLVDSTLCRFDVNIDTIIHSHYPAIAKMAKGRNILWLPEWVIKELKEEAFFTRYNLAGYGVPTEVRIFYAKEM